MTGKRAFAAGLYLGAIVAALTWLSVARATDFHSEDYWRERRGWASNAMTEGGRTPGTKRYRYAKAKRHHHHERWTHYQPEDMEGRDWTHAYRVEETRKGELVKQCLPFVRTVGEARFNLQDGIAAAKLHWMQLVRFDAGEKFMDPDQAEDMRVGCFLAEVSETAWQRFTASARETLGRDGWRQRCVVVARPCRDKLEQVEVLPDRASLKRRERTEQREEKANAVTVEPKKRFWERKK